MAFFAIFGVLAFISDRAITLGLRRIHTSDFGVLNQIMAGQVDVDIIISGSSRALVHYDPRVIQSATSHSTFNIGRNGSQTDMQVAFLKAYLRNNAKPKLIVHNLDLFTFIVSREIYEPVQYIPYLYDDALFAGIRRVYPDAWRWKYVPLYGYVVPDMRLTWMQGVKGLLGLNPPDDNFRGYVPRDIPWTEDFDQFKKSNPDGVSFQIEPQGMAAVAEIINLCRDNQISLLFVYSPEYILMQALERNREEIFSRFRSICSSSNVPLWDFSDSPISHNRNNFYNSQHLNASGSAAFSSAFAERLHAEWASLSPPSKPAQTEPEAR